MSLIVTKFYNESNKPAQKKMGKNYGQPLSAVPMTGLSRKPAEANKANDGKFSFLEAAKNFGKGLISPVTGLFESKKNFLIGAAMVIGSAALVVATGGAATPLLIGAGVAMGAVQGGKAAYKIATAKNGDDVEKAFYDVGGASSSIGLSVIGAKGSLKSAAVETKGLNVFSATMKCFTSAKSLAIESFTTFKNGYFKTNISNAIKPFFMPKAFKGYATQLSKEAKTNFESAFNETKSVLPESLKPLLKGRPKGKKSIYAKLLDECIMEPKIQKILKRADMTEVQKQTEVIKLKTKGEKYKSDINAAKEMVNDLIGTRLVLEDSSKSSISQLVTSLIDGIRSDKISIAEIRNYRGPNGHFYFSNSQITALKNAVGERGMNLTVLEGKKQIKSSGYNAVQLKIIHKNGSLGELQIRGKYVDKVADFEHIPYDLKTGKDISRGSNKIGELLAPFRQAVKKLTESEYVEYEKYLAKSYRYARRQELGLPSHKVRFPKTFDDMLSTESLHKLHEKTSHMPSKETFPMSLVPQTAVSYNFLKLTSGEKKQ